MSFYKTLGLLARSPILWSHLQTGFMNSPPTSTGSETGKAAVPVAATLPARWAYIQLSVQAHGFTTGKLTKAAQPARPYLWLRRKCFLLFQSEGESRRTYSLIWLLLCRRAGLIEKHPYSLPYKSELGGWSPQVTEQMLSITPGPAPLFLPPALEVT